VEAEDVGHVDRVPGVTTTECRDEDRLRRMIRSCDWMMRVLAAVREAELPDAWVGAGTIRDLVWGLLYGSGFTPGDVRDVDVVFFDPDDLTRDRDEQATSRLHHAWPQVPWQARNQAAVHTWYASKFGGDPVRPLLTIADAVATWPETATAVAARLDPAGRVELCAPFGLADLLGGVWRRNPRRASLQVSLARLARHKPQERWPAVKVIAPR
jgi:hypothetical protein